MRAQQNRSQSAPLGQARGRSLWYGAAENLQTARIRPMVLLDPVHVAPLLLTARFAQSGSVTLSRDGGGPVEERGHELPEAIVRLGRQRRNDPVLEFLRGEVLAYTAVRRNLGASWHSIAQELGAFDLGPLQRWSARATGETRGAHRARADAGSVHSARSAALA